MEYPIKLPPLAVIKAKALEALEAGELQCQQPGFRPNQGCSYTGPCAVGVALTEQQRQFLEDDSGARVEYLAEEGRVLVPDDELRPLQIIQDAHDKGAVEELRALLTA